MEKAIQQVNVKYGPPRDEAADAADRAADAKTVADNNDLQAAAKKAKCDDRLDNTAEYEELAAEYVAQKQLAKDEAEKALSDKVK